ncbi:hypothetical protein PIB30_040861 [Stylosanthes scabra]|uniref:Uncharacterized protein n=1 Tax=Stylosanthes scabra TaxID=79078 RepID=A0ABU6REV8_9FABA|nr:hypothetical protein [Stylosanthes scabra]
MPATDTDGDDDDEDDEASAAATLCDGTGMHVIEKIFRFQKGEAEMMRDAWLARAAKQHRELIHNVHEKG